MSIQTRYIKAAAAGGGGGGSTPLNTSNLFKTGVDTSYVTGDDGDLQRGRGVSFFTLDFNNGFGNTNRFTDDTGNQTYTSEVIVDWSTWNQVDSTVLAYYKTPLSDSPLSTHLSGQPYTRNSLSGWYVCNVSETTNIWNYSVYRNPFNYAPFNHSMTNSRTSIWTSTFEGVTGSSTLAFFHYQTSLNISSQGGNRSAFICRTYTLTELGL
jgi:hypothetical protein